jgi:hypothetical protein
MSLKEVYMQKQKMILLVAKADDLRVGLITPVLAWAAKKKGMLFETYLENNRDGRLFARTGSTVLGGNHFVQFNYLLNVYEVFFVLFGDTQVFDSSAALFGANIMARADTISVLYGEVQKALNLGSERALVFDDEFLRKGSPQSALLPYLYPEILFQEAWAFTASELPGDCVFSEISEIHWGDVLFENVKEDIFPFTRRLAEKWESHAKGVAFGDRDAIWSMLGYLCNENYIALYGNLQKKNLREIKVSAYTEEYSSACTFTGELANRLGNPVIVGRQTGDGDIFEWSRAGLCIRIMDPNRPAFPSVGGIFHPWQRRKGGWGYMEPDDAELERYAREGKILATVLWHSGEMAHNEAMAQLVDLSAMTGVKMGIGVHAARYETCPQLWELINVDVESGGVRGRIEPVVHCGGMGVMVEYTAKAGSIAKFCKQSMEKISDIAGNDALPHGYLAFLDSDLETLTETGTSIFREVADSGLEYYISSAMPGRNRILYEGGAMIALNQTTRNICGGSPYVRISNKDDIAESSVASPGWIIGTLDAPVVSFLPYIWRRGHLFMEIVDWLLSGRNIVNVLPHTISRYARILRKLGYVN